MYSLMMWVTNLFSERNLGVLVHELFFLIVLKVNGCKDKLTLFSQWGLWVTSNSVRKSAGGEYRGQKVGSKQ